MNRHKAVFCWSGGKDSAFALFRTIREGRFEVVGLLSTMNQLHGRLSMHGVREGLIEAQAASIGIPLEKVWVQEGTNPEYEKAMEEKLLSFKERGVSHVLFGDIFLEDLREYREKNLARVGLQAAFPIWKMDTRELIRSFLNEGFETILCCINDSYLREEFLGRKIDAAFLADLPAHVDPCGENGEFHSFCYAGPVFRNRIDFKTGEKVFRSLAEFGASGEGGFWYLDLIGTE